jgi:hypothetical protein
LSFLRFFFPSSIVTFAYHAKKTVAATMTRSDVISISKAQSAGPKSLLTRKELEYFGSYRFGAGNGKEH